MTTPPEGSVPARGPAGTAALARAAEFALVAVAACLASPSGCGPFPTRSQGAAPEASASRVTAIHPHGTGALIVTSAGTFRLELAPGTAPGGVERPSIWRRGRFSGSRGVPGEDAAVPVLDEAHEASGGMAAESRWDSARAMSTMPEDDRPRSGEACRGSAREGQPGSSARPAPPPRPKPVRAVLGGCEYFIDEGRLARECGGGRVRLLSAGHPVTAVAAYRDAIFFGTAGGGLRVAGLASLAIPGGPERVTALAPAGPYLLCGGERGLYLIDGASASRFRVLGPAAFPGPRRVLPGRPRCRELWDGLAKACPA